MSTASLPFVWIIVGGVSALDMYLAIKFSESLNIMETNALGRWLMECDGGSVALFMSLKLAGTMFVLGTITVMHAWRIRLASFIGWAVAIYQMGLACFLCAG